MHVDELTALTETFRRAADAAKADTVTAQQIRDALAESRLIEVFGAGDSLDVIDLLDAGGELVLRARLRELQLSDLRALLSAYNYDPEKETARWRSHNKFIELIIEKAKAQLAAERAAAAAARSTSGASWML